MILSFLLLAAAGAAPGPAPAAAPGEIKTFRDWTVGCDNGRACQAVGLMPENDMEAATAAVSRSAEPGAAPVAWLNVREGTPAAAIVDGRRFPLRPSPADAGFRPADAAAFVAALAAGRSAAVTDAAGKKLGALSVAGLSAALLYMDEKQGRLGTVTALVRKGPAPASAVPPAPALPVIVSAPASSKPARRPTPAQIKSARAGNACDDPSAEQPPQASRLDAATTLVLVPLACGSGAYNFLSIPLLLDESGKARPVKLVPGEEAGLYNAEWDAKARRLGTYMKGRGLGDCGTTQTFAWDGSRFRLAEQTEMGECRGSLDYITTWRARVVQR